MNEMRLDIESNSYTMRIQDVIVIISPLTRHSFLFSSSTVFMLSIHSASTGLLKNQILKRYILCLQQEIHRR